MGYNGLGRNGLGWDGLGRALSKWVGLGWVWLVQYTWIVLYSLTI